MKLGNSSQTQVPVPNFYLTKSVIEMDVFKTRTDMKRTFREKDLFRQTKDINLSNNFRNKQKLFEEYNKTKYIAIHKRDNYNKLLPEINKKPNTSNKYLEDYDKFQSYMYKTDISNFTNPNLRENIRSNINSLLERINSNYDMDKWNNNSSRPVFHKFTQETYSDLTLHNQNNPSESENFRNTLSDKLRTMSNFGTEKNKQNLLKTFSKITEAKNDKKQGFITAIRSTSVYDARKSELSDDEKLMQMQNTSVYDRFKDTQSFRDFPSPTRTEYSKKIGEKYSFLRRKNVEENNLENEKFDTIKHNGAFGETYSDTLNSLRKIVVIPEKVSY